MPTAQSPDETLGISRGIGIPADTRRRINVGLTFRVAQRRYTLAHRCLGVGTALQTGRCGPGNVGMHKRFDRVHTCMCTLSAE